MNRDELVALAAAADPEPEPIRCDADVSPSQSEGDDEIRLCDECGEARHGAIGEVMEYEPRTFYDPGRSGGSSWTCDVCETTYDCEFDRSI